MLAVYHSIFRRLNMKFLLPFVKLQQLLVILNMYLLKCHYYHGNYQQQHGICVYVVMFDFHSLDA